MLHVFPILIRVPSWLHRKHLYFATVIASVSMGDFEADFKVEMESIRHLQEFSL